MGFGEKWGAGAKGKEGKWDGRLVKAEKRRSDVKKQQEWGQSEARALMSRR